MAYQSCLLMEIDLYSGKASNVTSALCVGFFFLLGICFCVLVLIWLAQNLCFLWLRCSWYATSLHPIVCPSVHSMKSIIPLFSNFIKQTICADHICKIHLDLNILTFFNNRQNCDLQITWKIMRLKVTFRRMHFF